MCTAIPNNQLKINLLTRGPIDLHLHSYQTEPLHTIKPNRSFRPWLSILNSANLRENPFRLTFYLMGQNPQTTLGWPRRDFFFAPLAISRERLLPAAGSSAEMGKKHTQAAHSEKERNSCVRRNSSKPHQKLASQSKKLTLFIYARSYGTLDSATGKLSCFLGRRQPQRRSRSAGVGERELGWIFS